MVDIGQDNQTDDRCTHSSLLYAWLSKSISWPARLWMLCSTYSCHACVLVSSWVCQNHIVSEEVQIANMLRPLFLQESGQLSARLQWVTVTGWLALSANWFSYFVLVEIESCCVIFHVNLWTNSAKTLFYSENLAEMWSCVCRHGVSTSLSTSEIFFVIFVKYSINTF